MQRFLRFGGLLGIAAVVALLMLGFGSQLREAKAGVPGEIVLDPPAATNPVGTDHTVTATITVGGTPVVQVMVGFVVSAGPNAGAIGTCSADPNCATDGNGQVSFTYSDTAGVEGVDTIDACITNANPFELCASAEKHWQVPNTPPVGFCDESVNPSGGKVPPAGHTTLPGPKGGQNEDGFYQLIGLDAEDGTAPVFVSNASGSVVFGPFASGSVVKITEDPDATPISKPMGGPNSAIAAHIILDSDAVVFAVDSFGAVSPSVGCLVPQPPK
jgi:hypothetical protein